MIEAPVPSQDLEPRPNRLALGWIDTALELEAENRELQRLMTELILAIARNRDLLEYARGAIEARFPEERGT